MIERYRMAGRILLPVLPVTLLYLFGLATFWGGLLFFLVAELIRWVWVATHPTRGWLRPLAEVGGILCAPLFSLAILLLGSLWLVGASAQGELVDAFALYLCYIPYGIVAVLFFPRTADLPR